MTKNLMTLLTSSENDEEMNISQSVRDLNNDLFDAIEKEILTIENQEAGHEEELDTTSQGMHDTVEASTEAEASHGEKMDNIHPGVDEVVEASTEVSVAAMTVMLVEASTAASVATSVVTSASALAPPPSLRR